MKEIYGRRAKRKTQTKGKRKGNGRDAKAMGRN
jgi:hypothetical protein